MRLLGISHCRLCHTRPWRERCQRNFTIMQCSPDPAGDEHIVGWKRIFLEMESLLRLYRPFCDSDGWCKPQTTARRILQTSANWQPQNYGEERAVSFHIRWFEGSKKCLRPAHVFVLIMSMLCIIREIVGNFPLSTLSRATLTREVPAKLHNNTDFRGLTTSKLPRIA